MKIKKNLITFGILLVAVLAFHLSDAQADIQVYDNNNQYLGIFTDTYGNSGLEIFIPALGGILQFSTTDYWGWCGDELQVLFESDDCSGTPHARGSIPLIYDFSHTPKDGFYKVDYNGRKTFTPGSYYANPDCSCQTNTYYPSAEYYPYVQVQIPFTTPVALPLRFEVRTKAVVIPLN